MDVGGNDGGNRCRVKEGGHSDVSQRSIEKEETDPAVG